MAARDTLPESAPRPSIFHIIHTNPSFFHHLSIQTPIIDPSHLPNSSSIPLLLHTLYLANTPVKNLTNPSAPTKSPSLTNFATSKFNGLSASPPFAMSCWIASSVLTTPYVGVQLSFSRSRQISPVVKETFGWTQGVWKRMVGGAEG